MWCCGHIEDAMPSSFNVLLQTKAHPKIIMLFGLATKKSAQKVYRQKASTTKTTVHWCAVMEKAKFSYIHMYSVFSQQWALGKEHFSA